MSAYDMAFSDAIYGKSERYVSQERLSLMLDHEYELLIERPRRATGRCEPVFRVRRHRFRAAILLAPTKPTDGWGVRFQNEPNGPPSQIVMHVHMWDKENVLQQEALGIVGTNLLYAAFYYRDDPQKFINSLVDNLSAERIEVDMLEFLWSGIRTTR